MTWSIRRVSLLAHDVAAAERFFGAGLGLGATRAGYGDALRLTGPRRHLARAASELLAPIGARHVAIEVADLNRVVAALDRAAIAHVAAPVGDFGTEAVCTLDPGLNLVAFCESRAEPSARGSDWFIHHVNLEVPDVREAAAFYAEIAGMAEGPWRAPAERGDFSMDPAMLASLPLGDDNSGIHIVRADPGFALRNGFAHNPTIGGHPAFCVPDVLAVKRRLQAAGMLVSDAGVYAMAGMHQIYVFDPSGNMIEVNQRV
jgi:catechol 2,3-dioxygenase-like lactoylglutathione lyase family enzyme